MSFKLKKINDEVVKPIRLPKIDIKEIKGYELFPDLYPNIFICAYKKSGKTCSIFKILQSCINKTTKVYIFSSTYNRDDNMRHIIKWLKKKEIIHEVYHEIDPYLNVIIDDIEKNNKNEEDEKEKNKKEIENSKPKLISFNEDDEEIKIRIRKPKQLSPENFFIFDDISSDLKNPVVSKLVKQNRHYKSKCIISSQYPLDLKPESREQIEYWMLFKGIDNDKLEQLFKNIGLRMTFNEFLEVYKDATTERFHFLYIDKNNQKLRKDFNSEYLLNQ